MAFNLQEEGDLVYIEISIKPDICDIINMEMQRETEYWKTKALSNSDDSSLLIAEAPKRRKIRAKKKHQANQHLKDIDTILLEYKANYNSENISHLTFLTAIPSRRNMTFEEVRCQLQECVITSRRSKNFSVKNAYTFGSWLFLAEKLFRREKFLNKNHSLPKQFVGWIKTLGVSKTSADTYKKIYKLVMKAPRIVNCYISVNQILKNYDTLIEYFESDIQSPWKHNLDCTCDSCLAYFV